MRQHSISEGMSESEMEVEEKNSKMEESLTKMMINSSHISAFYHHLIDNNNKKKEKIGRKIMKAQWRWRATGGAVVGVMSAKKKRKFCEEEIIIAKMWSTK